MKSKILPRALLAPLLAGLVACSSVQTTAHKVDSTDFDLFRTYAWLDVDDAFPAGEAELVARTRLAAGDELADIGLREAPRGEAELWLDLHADVEVRERHRDPFFAFYRIERYEVGSVTITAVDPLDRRDLWTGTARAELRVLERGFGTATPTYTDAEEERAWPIEAMVAALIDEFPPRTRRDPTTLDLDEAN